jgi:hypothetical protein
MVFKFIKIRISNYHLYLLYKIIKCNQQERSFYHPMAPISKSATEPKFIDNPRALR